MVKLSFTCYTSIPSLNSIKDKVLQILRLLKYDFHPHCIRTLLISWPS